ncbi:MULTISPECIES: class I SAM-dependent methyltransferase [Mesonia]|uniref:Demethylmenaquinone methyltransferase n=1 Tax=Mesonia oceanica TaxID=2687242 RepID=A0AC61Y406_9FLAO|nr:MULTISPECIES: class I SAM-dependent methyltransferase [Mesonia]MAN28783.1 methyltransferase type 11 [Mesonia sp.]MAQ41885.1 methyltransferase type 11 [Mesonia sp.]MBJ98992.1 methyltransferase type 11 [Flavobacteriaceae bacterium]VVU99190.1 Demethylmenaquinone methyltransferase [Mesonia oceanica]|tara:strand:+ start:137 stop:853 length:717 start_codon:yes stop_codon:yes gene_type:complete
MKEIYDPKFVEKLFDKMSSSYSRVNYITSFGFSERWRRKCVEEIKIKEGSIIVDLMTGMVECWKFILKNSGDNSKLIGLDFSTEMINRAELNKLKFKNSKIEILKENVFDNSISDETVDLVISGFGLKTFNNEQLRKLSIEIERILKPNGEFSLIDVSVPENKSLRSMYMFYLKNIIPVLGKLFLGNPNTYKMLGIYTEAYGNSKNVFKIFNERKFQIEYIEYFFGCATGIKGKKLKN